MHHKGNQACCHISQPEVAGVSPGDTFTLPCRVYQVEMVLDPRGQTPGQPTPQPQLRVKTWWPPRWMSLAPALWLCELPTPRQLPQAPGSSGRRAGLPALASTLLSCIQGTLLSLPLVPGHLIPPCCLASTCSPLGLAGLPQCVASVGTQSYPSRQSTLQG